MISQIGNPLFRQGGHRRLPDIRSTLSTYNIQGPRLYCKTSADIRIHPYLHLLLSNPRDQHHYNSSPRRHSARPSTRTMYMAQLLQSDLRNHHFSFVAFVESTPSPIPIHVIIIPLRCQQLVEDSTSSAPPATMTRHGVDHSALRQEHSS